ncbi:hypothetical protein [Hydrogenibacillus sp. N12]|uniref:hypothetical protein n=1 Tax=Hydrogenibacillus sp. N12 TaxID=2866627 RepID=UPI001C7E0EF0|nr:hypothetical protein [Hydrogenibacillus sp. N12]QZA33416.1 hypothetical protein K2M58_02400 [Hydrogenibacillus sp. N12]
MDVWHEYSTVKLLQYLIPASNFLFVDRLGEDEAIFHYRRGIYFVYDDGAIVGMPKPKRWETLSLADLWGLLYRSPFVKDYDEAGIFDLGEFLKDIGYVVATRRTPLVHLFTIAPRYAPEDIVEEVRMEGVSFPFALYHAIMACTRHYHRSNREVEYVITGIDSYSLPKERRLGHTKG